MRLFLALPLLMIATSARGDSVWSVTTADFNKSVVTVSSLDDHKLTGSGRDKAIELPVGQILRLDRERAESAATGHFTLITASGDRLTGEIVELKDDVLTWSNPVLGTLKFPVDSLRAIFRGAAPQAGLDAERKEDQVVLTNHDVVRGVVGGIEDASIQMQVNGDSAPVKLAAADAILFASSAKPKEAEARAFLLWFVDGSRYTTRTVKLSGSKAALALADGTTKEIDQGNILSIAQVNGPVKWLSDQAPTANEQESFNSEISFPARFDRNVFGKQLRVGSQTYEKGIGMHANSRLVFALDGSYKIFRTRYGIDTTSDASKADVNVRILLDDKVVHEKQHVRAYAPTDVVSVEVGSAKTVTLEVTAAGPTDTQDRLDWVETALVRESMPPASAATQAAGH